uniref:Uncharacterized protein n=1 Tax=Daphnia galeata TaxID=27404 RepID=A0A8J2RH46_9CRUS|nr:unnamed protein product [Daphnia galeata]
MLRIGNIASVRFRANNSNDANEYGYQEYQPIIDPTKGMASTELSQETYYILLKFSNVELGMGILDFIKFHCTSWFVLKSDSSAETDKVCVANFYVAKRSQVFLQVSCF